MSAAYCGNTEKSAAKKKNGSGTTEFWYNCDWDGAIDLMPTDVAKIRLPYFQCICETTQLKYSEFKTLISC